MKAAVLNFFRSDFKERFKKPGKNLFWVWIAYQVVKGTTTTTLIWLPLLYVWFHSGLHP